MKLNRQYLSSLEDGRLREAYNLYLDVYLSWGNYSPISFKEFQDSYARSDDYNPVFVYYFNKKFIGYGLVMNNNPLHHRLDIGYAVQEAERKKGYGYYIANDVILEAKSRFNPSLIIADVFGENLGSKAILKKLGFIKSGTTPSWNWSTGEPRELSQFYKVV